MIRAWLLAAACLVAISAAAQGDNKSVADLVRDLSSNDFTVRDAAIKAIEKLGPDALDELKKHKDHPDLEVRRHIEKWLPQFEKEQVVRPRRVTLKLADRPLREAAAEIARQTGIKIELARDEEKDKKLYTFQFDNATFWEAIERLAREAEVELQPGEDRALHLVHADHHSPFVHLHGAFRMRAANLNWNAYQSTSKHIQFANLPRKGEAPRAQEHKNDSRHVQFSFMIAAEPRLPLTGVGQPLLTEALDDKGQSLLPKQDERVRIRGGRFQALAGAGLGGFHQGEQYAAVQLQPPSDNARAIKVIRGSIPVFLEKDRKTAVLLNDLKNVQGKKLKVGNATIEIDYFKSSNANRHSLYFTVTRDKPANNDDEDGGGFDGALDLQDDKGNSFAIHGSGSSSDGTTSEIHYTYGPPFNGGNVGAPARLVYTTAAAMEYLVPFEFKDLPLP